MGKLSGADLFYAHLTEYLDDVLASDVKQEIKSFAESDQGTKVSEDFQKNRGWMQFELQQLYLSEDETLALRRLIGDQEDRQNVEEANISDITRGVFWGNLKRNIGIWGLLIGLIFVFIYFLTPKSQVKFNPLQYVEYESLEYESSPSRSMDFPSTSHLEIQGFLDRSPKLSTTPKVLKPFGNGWTIEGASFIDYDTASMSVTQYGNKQLNEKMFHYAFDGQLSDLPKSVVGDVQGLKYQTYASDKVNIVAWDGGDGLVYLLVGRRAAQDMAKYAKTGTAE